MILTYTLQIRHVLCSTVVKIVFLLNKTWKQSGKHLVRVTDGTGRQSATVLNTVSIDGGYLLPFIAFDGVTVQTRWGFWVSPAL